MCRTAEHMAQLKKAAGTQHQLSVVMQKCKSRVIKLLDFFPETLSHHKDKYCVEQTVLLRARFNPQTDSL